MMMSASHIPFVKEFPKLRSSWKQVLKRNQILDLAPSFLEWDRFKKLEFGSQLFKKMDLAPSFSKAGAPPFGVDSARPPGCSVSRLARSLIIQFLN